MSRFSDDYDEPHPGAAGMWWANVRRALAGKKGQAALADLEEALLALPEKRLVEGKIATKDGGVCAVGALVAYRRVRKGAERAEVLAELEEIVQNDCETCFHLERHHGEAGCVRCLENNEARVRHGQEPMLCTQFVDSGYGLGDGDYETAQVGTTVGLTFALAWRLAYLNDGDLEGVSEEARYDAVLDWVRKNRVATPVG